VCGVNFVGEREVEAVARAEGAVIKFTAKDAKYFVKERKVFFTSLWV
jgi:hypothetical protein